MMKFSTPLLAAAVLVTGSNIARAVDVDVLPYASDGKIVTGGWSDDTETLVFEQGTVYGGEIASNGSFLTSDEPGFNNEDAERPLTPGSNLAFNVLPNSFSNSRVGYWNGTGAVQFAAVSLGFSVTLASQLTSDSVTFDGSINLTQTGFNIKSPLVDGYVHEHLDQFFPLSAAEGIYLVSLQLTSATLTSSDPIFLVINNGLSEETHDAAIAAVPEPASLGLLGLGVVAALRRRRHSR